MLNVKALLTKILQRLRPTSMFVVEKHTSAQHTQNGGANLETSLTVTKSGYYPLGIVGYHSFWVSGSTAALTYYSMRMDTMSSGSGTVKYAVRNSGSSQTKWKLDVWVLWMKE